MRYKQFLNENDETINDQHAIEWMLTNSKQYLLNCFRYTNPRFIYRGLSTSAAQNKKNILSKPRLNRVSVNTQNIYTVIINEHPSWKGFPKRSTICTTNKRYTKNFGFTQICILKDNTILGICPDCDMWDSYTEFEAPYLNNQLNRIFEIVEPNLSKIKSLTELKKLCEKVEKYIKENKDNEDDRNYNLIKFSIGPGSMSRTYDMNSSLFDYIIMMYNPSKFKNIKCQDFKFDKFKDNEVWFDQECIMIDPNIFLEKFYPILKEELGI